MKIQASRTLVVLAASMLAMGITATLAGYMITHGPDLFKAELDSFHHILC